MAKPDGYLCFPDHLDDVKAHVADCINLKQRESLERIADDLRGVIYEIDQALYYMPKPKRYEIWKVDVINHMTPKRSATYSGEYSEEEARQIVAENEVSEKFGDRHLIYYAKEVN